MALSNAAGLDGASPATRRRTNGWSRAGRHPAVIALAGLVVLAALLPLGFIVAVTFETGWDTVYELVVRPRVGELLTNTLLLEGLTVPTAIVVAVGLAWLVERTDLPGRRLWSWLAIAPLAIPAFVHSYAWNTATPSLHGLGAAVLVSVLAYTPFLYLPVAAQLRRLDPALEEVAGSLGLTRWAIFRRVVLPQLRLAIAGGALLVGLHLLAEYGLFALLRFNTFATAIVDQYQSAYTGPAANMLGGVLVLCCIGLLALEQQIRGGARYARVGSGSARDPRQYRLGRAVIPALLFNAAFAVLAIGVPLFVLGRWLNFGGIAIWQNAGIGFAFAETIGLALAGALLTTLAALPMAWLSVRAPGPLQRLFEAAHYYVGSLPGIIVALALVTITVHTIPPLYQTGTILLFAYVLLFLPRALVGLRASLVQAPPELEQAAGSLGNGPMRAVWRTTMRLAAPGAAASIALVALGITNELTATLMLAPNGTATLAMRFWAYTSELDYAAAAPYALMMIVFSLPLTLLLRAQAERAGGR